MIKDLSRSVSWGKEYFSGKSDFCHVEKATEKGECDPADGLQRIGQQVGSVA